MDEINYFDSDWNIILYKTKNNYNNVAISNLDIEDKIIVPNEIINFNITVANNGEYNLEDRIIELYINDIKVGFKEFDISSKSSNTSLFIP